MKRRFSILLLAYAFFAMGLFRSAQDARVLDGGLTLVICAQAMESESPAPVSPEHHSTDCCILTARFGLDGSALVAVGCDAYRPVWHLASSFRIETGAKRPVMQSFVLRLPRGPPREAV